MNSLYEDNKVTGQNESTDGPLRLLVVGPLPPPIGGTRVNFKTLVDGLRRRPDVALTLVPTPPVRDRKLASLFRIPAELARIFRAARSADVITLHCGGTAIESRGAAVALIARLWRKPLVIRTFGGMDFRTQAGRIRRAVIRRVLRSADAYLAQTKYLVESARADGMQHVRWFANNRPVPPETELRPRRSPKCDRFLFLGHVRKLKGILELIEAGERFAGTDVRIDVYGTMRHDLDEGVFRGLQVVRYCGPVDPQQVPEVMAAYDALLLPSHQEGYPGTVIEAYSAGLPVICTRVGGVPEIVDESCGILVKPHSADALYEAMKTLTQDSRLYQRLCRGVLRKRKQFDSKLWTDRFVEVCAQVSRRAA